MEENSKDFCPNYVQEFGLRGHVVRHTLLTYDYVTRYIGPNTCGQKYVARQMLSDTCCLINVVRCTWPEVRAWVCAGTCIFTVWTEPAAMHHIGSPYHQTACSQNHVARHMKATAFCVIETGGEKHVSDMWKECNVDKVTWSLTRVQSHVI